MRLNWNAYYALLFLYRCVFSVLGQTVVMRLTSIPDTHGYQSHGLYYVASATSQMSSLDPGLTMQAQATLITAIVGAFFSFLGGGNPILINIGFQTIAFIGVWRMLDALDPEIRKYCAVLVMLPSFSVWSSIASKEAIVVFLVGMLGRYIIQIYQGRGRLGILHVPWFFLLYVFKPQFAPAILFLIGVPLVARWWRQPAAIALGAGVVSLIPLYLLRDSIDAYVLLVVGGVYAEPGASTRDERIISEAYDFFAHAPQGMFRAFMGPTLSEATSGILHLMSFTESILIVVLILLYVVPRLPRLPVYLAIVSFFTIFWVLLANYPLGIANPGTAVRYRTDWLLLIFLGTIFLCSRAVYLRWRAPRARLVRIEESQPAAVPQPG